MTMSNRERDAIEHFLLALETPEEARARVRAERERLVERTRREPQKVIEYYDLLPEGPEKLNPLLKKLYVIAANAMFEKKFSSGES